MRLGPWQVIHKKGFCPEISKSEANAYLPWWRYLIPWYEIEINIIRALFITHDYESFSDINHSDRISQIPDGLEFLDN